MSTSNFSIIPEIKSVNDYTENYSEILEGARLKYKSSEYYWQVGDPSLSGDWTLSLSVIKSQLSKLLSLLIPLLAKNGFPFKIVRDGSIAQMALDGHLGTLYLAKMICIYPPDVISAVSFAKELIALTASFTGPAIRTDRLLGGIVYASPNKLRNRTHTNTPKFHWPFNDLATNTVAVQPNLLNHKYYPFFVIKPDAKGDVLAALYFKRPWKIKRCIIKQGRQNMLMDASGRDIRDRLLWQYEIHSQLIESIPIPKMFDYFIWGTDTYVAMEFINGISLTRYLNKLYDGKAWPDLPTTSQINLIEILLEIFRIIQLLHDKGYVHRDITPENFLIDKKKQVWLIDIELMWSSNSNLPDPPFALGTPGFMSPEQSKVAKPTVQEDIYAIGGLLSAFFINLDPQKFQGEFNDKLKRNFNFFINVEIIASTITDCLQSNPSLRPNLKLIVARLSKLKKWIEDRKPKSQYNTGNPKSSLHNLNTTIQSALNGLAMPSQLDFAERWISQIPPDSKCIGNELLGIKVQEGWYRGTSGPLWLVALASQLGYNTELAIPAYKRSWQYLNEVYLSNPNIKDASLFAGGGGIGMALSAGMNAGLLPVNDINLDRLNLCFGTDLARLNLCEGLAGYGISLLNARKWLKPSHTQRLLASYIKHLISYQRPDGSWSNMDREGKHIYSLSYGAPGIIWFLLSSLQITFDINVKLTTVKALTWLIKQLHKNRGFYRPSLEATSYAWNTENGLPGLALTFTKAFLVLGGQEYKLLAEQMLRSIPERLVTPDFSLATGLTGIGEVYLEAYSVFGDPEWYERSEWIAQVLVHTLKNENDFQAYWLPNSQSTCTADLFTGNSGLIHFLFRHNHPDSVTHPLNPINNNNI